MSNFIIVEVFRAKFIIKKYYKMNINNANQYSSSLFDGEVTSTELSTGLALASTAILGGFYYYYMNNDSTNKTPRIIDHRNQTREVNVNKI